MVLFEDDFQDNRNNWDLGDNERGYFSIEDGALKLAVASEDGLVLRKCFPAAGFEIEQFTLKAIVQWCTGDDSGGYGIHFAGLATSENSYQSLCKFFVAADGTWAIAGLRGYLIPWQEDALVRRHSAYNTLAIECVDAIIRFHLNGVCVAQLETELFGDGIFTHYGLECYSIMTVRVCRLELTAPDPIVAAIPLYTIYEHRLKELEKQVENLHAQIVTRKKTALSTAQSDHVTAIQVTDKVDYCSSHGIDEDDSSPEQSVAVGS